MGCISLNIFPFLCVGSYVVDYYIRYMNIEEKRKRFQGGKENVRKGGIWSKPQ